MRYNHRPDHSQVLSYEHGRYPKMKLKAAEECFIPSCARSRPPRGIW